jgi:hypothetical protein
VVKYLIFIAGFMIDIHFRLELLQKLILRINNLGKMPKNYHCCNSRRDCARRNNFCSFIL